MSDHSDSSQGTDCSQGNSINKCEKSEQERFYKVYADIGEIILRFLTGEAFLSLAERLSLVLHGAWLPVSGHASIRVLAALLNRSESAIRRTVGRLNVPVATIGSEGLYDVKTIAVLAAAAGSDTEENSPA